MFENILNYQKLDLKLIKLEKELAESVNKKIISEMVALVKELQGKSVELENNSKEQLQRYETMKASYEKQFKEVEDLTKVSVEKLNEEELDKHIEKLNAANQNLQSLAFKIAAAHDLMQNTVRDFEQTKKRVIIARQKHKEAKTAYESESASIQPDIDSLKKELNTITVEENLLKKYNHLKEDRIMPVFVPVRDDCCGACMTRIPTSLLNKLKDEKKLECEHCHRIIILGQN